MSESSDGKTTAPRIAGPVQRADTGAPAVRKTGTHDFAAWKMAGRLTSLDKVQPGDVLFKDSAQFDALNLCVVTQTDPDRGCVYARFIDPRQPDCGRDGGTPEPEFCIWDFEVSAPSFGNRYIKATRAGPLCRNPDDVLERTLS